MHFVICAIDSKSSPQSSIHLPSKHLPPAIKATSRLYLPLSPISSCLRTRDMFSTSVGRVVRSTCSACSPPARLSARSSSACLAATNRSHQRRPSSSKASIPPDGSRRSTASDQQTSTSTSRVGRRKAKDTTSASPVTESRNQPFAKQYPNLPRVDSTQHLHPSGS